MGRFLIPADVVPSARGATMFWVSDGILYGQSQAESPQRDLQTATAEIEEIRQLTGGVALPLFMDARNVGWLQLDARDYIRSHAAELFTRAAIVVKPELVEMMKYAVPDGPEPPIPTKICIDEEEGWRFIHES